MWTRRQFLLFSAMHAPFMARAGSLSTPRSGPGRPAELLHLRLLASHWAEQRTFYEKTLGLPVVTSTATSVTFRAGDTMLEFVEAKTDAPPVYHFAFNIPENKIERATEWMKDRSPLTLKIHFEAWNADSIYFVDPAGNIVEFIARHSLPNAASGDFSVRDLLRVSEIGLVVDDVPALVETLKKETGVDHYIGGSGGFVPLGNEYGLFIIVNTGRTWLGSNQIAAHPFAVSIGMHDEAKHPYTVQFAGDQAVTIHK